MAPEATDVLGALTAVAEAIAQEAEGELSNPELGEIECFRAAHARLKGRGVFRYVVPESFGGTGVSGLAQPGAVSVRAIAALRKAFAFRHAMLDLALVEQGLGSLPIALGSSDRELRDVLKSVAEGDVVPALALTEPGAGSDLAGVATTARREDDEWVLDGQKTYITNVGVADFYTVLARTSGSPGERGGLTMFYVPHRSDAAGTAGLRTESFQVMAPHPIGEVHFDGVRIPERYVLGEVGAGMELALANLARFRVTVAAAACGFARRALAESVTHLKRREQFGRPLSKFQGLRFDVAEMDVELRAAELLTDEAASLVDTGVDATAEVARAKLFATETASRIADRAVQLHGGAGVRVGTVVERIYRDTRALRIYEGTSEVQKLVLAGYVFDNTPDPNFD